MLTNRRLKELIQFNHPNIYPDKAIDLFLNYKNLLLDENKTQNLTRITEDEDFYYNNFLDIHFLLNSGYLDKDKINFDLGSGGGIPGLLAATLSNEYKWVLSESEKKKAEFLSKTVEKLGLSSHVTVSSVRAEAYLKNAKLDFCIVSRAVGRVSKLFNIIRKCSTWNTLILFKGPGWDAEWSEYLKTSDKNQLKIERKIEYSSNEKKRYLIILKKVPRGTK